MRPDAGYRRSVPVEFSVRPADIGAGEHVLTLAGELDLYSAPELEQALDEALEAGATRIILDMLSVTFLDSTGLAVVTGAAKRARAAGSDLVLVIDRQDILRVFRITGLDRFLTVRPSLAAALGGTLGRTA